MTKHLDSIVLALWGKGGAGKTSTAIALASLAAKATVHAKAAAQAASDVADNFSLGSLLAAPADISGDVSGSTAFDK